jgi:hypothetical protein
MDQTAQSHYEGPVNEPPEPDEAEQLADADLDALDAIAEALLEAIQAGTDEEPGPEEPKPPRDQAVGS